MKRILIILLFASHIVYGQSKIQHEPERLFNKLDLGMSLNDYIKKHNIKNIRFFRDTILSSSHEFDKKGNTIIQIGMENDRVRKTTYKYDNDNRQIEAKYYNPDESFRNGYYYKFKDGVKEMYKIEDSLLFRKTAYIQPENFRIYSEYNEDGSLKLKNFYVLNDEEKYLLETRFYGNIINVQYRWEYFDHKKYVTKIQYDQNGTKISEKRRLTEEKIPNENKLNYYRESDDSLFRIDYFDDDGNLIKMEIYEINGELFRTETNEFNSNGQLFKVTNENFNRIEKIEYEYLYDKSNRITRILKTTNGITEEFKYHYITHE